MTVKNIKLYSSGNAIEWTLDSGVVKKTYNGRITAVALANETGVLVVEPYKGDPDNAVILDENGAERVRIANPLTGSGAICFSDAGYENGELTLISRLPGLEVACVIDERGHLVRKYEIR